MLQHTAQKCYQFPKELLSVKLYFVHELSHVAPCHSGWHPSHLCTDGSLPLPLCFQGLIQVRYGYENDKTELVIVAGMAAARISLSYHDFRKCGIRQGEPLLCSGSKGIQLDGPGMEYRQFLNCRFSYTISVLQAKEALSNKSMGKSIPVLLQQDLLSIPLCSFDAITPKANSSQSKLTVAVQTHQTSVHLQRMHIRA